MGGSGDTGDTGDTDEDGTGLPASIEAAWGVRERPGRGPRPGLSLGRIVDAAVTVAVRDGLAAVSMARVAADLGASTMSLYRYVAAKDELLDLMIDAVFATPPEDPRPGEGWRSALSRWTWEHRAVLRRHPWVLRVPVTGPPITPNQVAWLEHGLRSLRDTGLTEGEKLSVIVLLSGFVRNASAQEAAVTEAARTAAGRAGEVASYWRTLAKLVDPQRFPEVSALIASGVTDEPDDPDADFGFGLDRVLDGIDALVRARRAEREPTSGSRRV
ncbi:transcriptional regulator, TetR family [Streptoalloteichus tenebrarius]|uniref:Transcriptional regulator, TetR family n=1 Tax=Streptoalloteichus tenebrarius (strain ATCC 17920 / DSM 40477 / JCM 4838 / CBS 697.72 / NBRC 16177 / NCIMB 11028 / NRRL B-12390 / A12253. 1 / ISP 5477) TaxID=1933 RepID=A0ABT1HWS7_STRSD|nr:TetR/AcrR family transcriptional regulator [Streptoalloteichus tenebrarius]MCP2259980.1 transcriptional regulator, TetR family [Streptoalloteichus tenebrarius]BFF03908.1 TetR/AcrR family transcriptional regulator [Streptoalloteichus tenebrarius]